MKTSASKKNSNPRKDLTADKVQTFLLKDKKKQPEKH